MSTVFAISEVELMDYWQLVLTVKHRRTVWKHALALPNSSLPDGMRKVCDGMAAYWIERAAEDQRLCEVTDWQHFDKMLGQSGSRAKVDDEREILADMQRMLKIKTDEDEAN